MLEIRYVYEADKTFWFTLDKHFCEREFALKIRDKRGYVICVEGTSIGIMRYNLLWDNTPFLTLIYIEEKGLWQAGDAILGKRNVRSWLQNGDDLNAS